MNKSVKAWWNKQAARIDALSLRERGILFVLTIAVTFALADTLFLSPAQMAYKQVTQRFAAQNTELKRLRDDLTASGQPVDASKAVREEIAQMDAQILATNDAIKTLAPLAEGGPALEQVLVQFLRRQDGLTLLGVGTLKADLPATPVTTAAPAPGGAAVAGLSKRGLDLRVSGPYPELVRYVKNLENALPVLRWGAMQLKSEKQPPELSLQVYVVEAQP